MAWAVLISTAALLGVLAWFPLSIWWRYWKDSGWKLKTCPMCGGTGMALQMVVIHGEDPKLERCRLCHGAGLALYGGSKPVPEHLRRTLARLRGPRR